MEHPFQDKTAKAEPVVKQPTTAATTVEQNRYGQQYVRIGTNAVFTVVRQPPPTASSNTHADLASAAALRNLANRAAATKRRSAPTQAVSAYSRK